MSQLTKWVIVSVLLLCLAAWFLSPLRSPSSSQMVGRYEVALPWGEASLQLNADQTFREVVHLSTGENHEIEGRWSFNPTWQASLFLKPFWQFSQSEPGTEAESVTLPVERWWFQSIRIEFGDFDSDIKLRKQ